MILEWLNILWMFCGIAALTLTLPGTVELILLTAGGIMSRRYRSIDAATNLSKNFRLAVVVPAHNEAAGIINCLRSLFACKDEGICVVVVADNCTDETAAIAEEAGARVLVRTNAAERGKGFALDFAFTQLLKENFDGFLVVDADSVVAPNLFRETRRKLSAGADAVQCRYQPANPDSSRRTRLMNVSLLAFNVLRPRGRDFFGLSSGILGNGFGLRAETLIAVPYRARSVVEDLEYHLELIKNGFRVEFIDETAVFGEMPASGAGVETQRARWEGGRLRMLGQFAPKLFAEILRGRFRLVEPLLELLLLPLAFHVALLMCTLLQSDFRLQLAALCSLGVVAAHIIAGLAVGGGGSKDLAALLNAPFYILWKMTMLKSLIKSAAGDTEWVRTERAGSGENL